MMIILYINIYNMMMMYKCIIKLWYLHAGERFDERWRGEGGGGGVAERERCGNGAVWSETVTNGE